MAPVVFIGDDFTGASDTLSTLARAGWRTRLFLDAPTPDACRGYDAVGIATALRALDPNAGRQVIDSLWPAIAALRPQTIHLKVCSTFDSSAQVGSIGAVANRLVEHFSPDHLAVIGGQPSLGRYCVFGTLFARAADAEIYRIDRHPVMANHPVTPMNEADLRLALAAQGLEDLALIGPDDQVASPVRALFDAWEPRHITRIGETLGALTGRKLLIGASSVPEALTQGIAGRGAAQDLPAVPNSRVLVFAGSRSETTRVQVASAKGFDKISLKAQDFMRSEPVIARAAACLAEGGRCLLHTDPNEDYCMSSDQLAEASARMLSQILARQPVGWLGIAGGDTSSRICHRLTFTSIAFEAPLSPGVGLCCASHPDPGLNGVRLMLKGGQMGERDLFDRFACLSDA